MHGRFSRFSVLLFPVCAAILLASCDTGSPTGPRIVSLTQVSGNEQAAAVGATMPDPIVVRAVDQNGVPVPGVPIEWAVLSGGGSFVAASSATDQDGLGQAVFRLGNAIGTQRVSATVGSQPPVIFSLTATAAPASQLKVSSGNNQTGTVGAALSSQLVVSVTDAVNNPKSGVPVTFAVASGGGSVAVGSSLTNSLGLASVTWTLGTGSGAQAVVASSQGLPAVTFSATGVAAAPAAMVIVTGNNQVGSPGVTLPTALRIRINDQYGNGVPGVPVTFGATAADGTVSPPSALTGADGTAQGSWTLGPAGGLKLVTATAGPLMVEFAAGSSVTYANVSAGGRHTCAVSTDNVLYCWGYNGDGQLGVGTSAIGSGPVYSVPQPSAVNGAQTFVAVSSGAYHTCGWTLSYNPYCWGKNVDGRVGNGGSEQVDAPAHLSGPTVFRLISSGASHACGLTPADRLYCWGNGRDGQVGDGGVAPAVAIAVEVAGNNRFSTLSAGGLHTCGITLGGSTLCWGVNLRGELGDGSTTDRLVPTLIAGGAPFVRVASGGEHTCALAATGAAWCWGDNTYGQLGDGSNASSSLPVLVAGGMIFESISAGMHHTCGVVGGPPPSGGVAPAGGGLSCWGRNSSGQLGNGSQISVNQPTAASGGLSFVSVSGGDFASCGVTTTNRAYCWGDNQYGQLGDGTTVRRTTPTKVAFQP
ncbi:MAG: hypothetical protein SGI84_14405 [Gemmatimonadota bacterium]|nr:hypothetical protein [Gemmatimonadota bacterium]